jgi:uncharacterized protein
MAFNIGVNVVEVDGKASPAIVAAPISIPGFLIRSQRGVPNLAVNVQGFTDFVNNFGGPQAGLYGAHAVRGFFDNGGTQAYVVRVVSSAGTNAAQAANVILNDRAGTVTLRVSAGLRGREDPGQWGNDLAVQIINHARGISAIPAQMLSVNAAPFALTDGATLDITIDGAAAPVVITFRAPQFQNIAAATAAEVAAAVNRQSAALRASATPNQHLILASSTSGGHSRLAVAGGAAATALGFTGANANSDTGLTAGTSLMMLLSTGGFTSGSAVQMETPGHILAPNPLAATTNIPANSGIHVTPDGGTAQPVIFIAADFADNANATPLEIVAAINRKANGFFADLTFDNHLILSSVTYGPASTISVAAPGGGAADATNELGLTGNVPAAGSRIMAALNLVSDGSKYIALVNGLPAGGLPANLGRIVSVEFDLAILRLNPSSGRYDEVERFESLSMQNSLTYYVSSVVNDPLSGSRYIMVTDQASGSGPGMNAPAENRNSAGQNLPYPLGASLATHGQDGGSPSDNDFIGDPAARSGLYAFDLARIQMLGCPESSSPGVVLASLSYCENRGDAMFIGSPPKGYDLNGIKAYASAFRGRKVYGAMYAPWIQIVNPLDTTGTVPRLWIPPVGHVMGVYARIGDARGVWKAPAGDEAQLLNALGVEFDMTDVDHTDLVKNGSVNGIRAIPGSGIIVDASRTLSTDTRWLYVNVRRLFNFVKSSLKDGLRWVAQEPNSGDLQRSVKFNVITPFLLGLWRQGAFGSDKPEQVFTVICDASNNPPSEVMLGNFKVEVYFYAARPVETIVIIVGQQESGATASEG